MWEQPSPCPRQELLKHVSGANGIYCSLTDKIDKELLDSAGPGLKVVATISVGHDHIDLEECKKRGIRIGYTPDVLTDATAELTVFIHIPLKSQYRPYTVEDWGKKLLNDI